DFRWNIDRTHRLPRSLADALYDNRSRRDVRPIFRDDAFVGKRARVLSNNSQMHVEFIFELQGPVVLEGCGNSRPYNAGPILRAEARFAPHRVLGLFQISKVPAEMDDARHVGLVELDAPPQ